MKKKKLLFLSFILVFLQISFISEKPHQTVSAATNSFNQGIQYEQGSYQNASQPMNGVNWSKKSHVYGSDTNEMQWKMPFAANWYAPLVDKDGTIYTNNGNVFTAMNPDGSKKWEQITSTRVVSSPMIAEDGTIYVPGGRFYAFNPDGSLKWKFDLGNNGFTPSPALGSDGTIYAYYNIEEELYAINPDGTLKWKTVNMFNSSINNGGGVMIDKKGQIYVITYDGYVYALNKKGELLWKRERLKSDSYADGTYGISPDGMIYVISGNVLFILNPEDGSTSKQIDLGSSSYITAPSFDMTDGTFYIGIGKDMKAFNADGTVKWTYQGNAGYIASAPIIDAEGTIYFGIIGNGFYAIRKDGTVKWGQKEEFVSPSFYGKSGSFSLSPNGIIYGTLQENVNSKVTYSFFALGEAKEQPNSMPEDACFGYLEKLEDKIKKQTLTESEIKEARHRLIKALYDINQLETENKVLE